MAFFSENFSRHEFACSCGCGFDTVDATLLEALETIRGHFAEPITVTSGCRCHTYNMSIGGVARSQHVKGRAADIQVKNTPPDEVATYAEELGLSVGRYNYFTHCDTRTGVPKRWSA